MPKQQDDPFAAMTGESSPDPEMSRELVVAEETAIERPMREYSTNFSDVLEQEDVYHPRLRLAQGLTPEVQAGEAKPGTFLVIGHDPMKEVTFIPLAVNKSRNLREGDDSVCYASDAKTGVGEPGGDCKSCPMAKWRPNPDGSKKNIPPSCHVTYSYVGYTIEHDQLIQLDLRDSMSTGEAAQYINTVLQGKRGKDVAFTLSSRQEQGKKGSYYKAQARVKSDIDPDTFQMARSLMGVE